MSRSSDFPFTKYGVRVKMMLAPAALAWALGKASRENASEQWEDEGKRLVALVKAKEKNEPQQARLLRNDLEGFYEESSALLAAMDQAESNSLSEPQLRLEQLMNAMLEVDCKERT